MSTSSGTIDATLISAFIRQARGETADGTDAQTIAVLTNWQATALENVTDEVTITSVSMAGQSAAGVTRDFDSAQLVRLCELAIERLEGNRQDGRTRLRARGYSRT